MPTLLLRLAGPLQSWGCQPEFNRRTTGAWPTKSGLTGMLAAALGRDREDPLEDLRRLRITIRIDQPGMAKCDYQNIHLEPGTYKKPGDSGGTQLYKYYLQDAVFLAAVESPDAGLLHHLEAALLSPQHTLYLGRKCCPPTYPLILGVREGSGVDVLRHEPWQATRTYKRRCRRQPLLRIIKDGTAKNVTSVVSDDPISFSSSRRQHNARLLTEEWICPPEPKPAPQPETEPAAPAAASEEPKKKTAGKRKEKRVPHDPLGWI